MSLRIPKRPIKLTQDLSNDYKNARKQHPKFYDSLIYKMDSFAHFSKILSKSKLIHSIKIRHPSKTFPKFLHKILTRSPRAQTIKFPSPISPHNLRPFPNLRTLSIQERHTRKNIPNPHVSNVHLYLTLATMTNKEISSRKIPQIFRLHNLQHFNIYTRWTVGTVSVVRSLAQHLSKLPTLKSTSLFAEEVDMHLYFHSFHPLVFWEKLNTLVVIVDTWESFSGALDYTQKLANLKLFRLETGKKFTENCVKKPNFSLNVANKLGAFPSLETMELFLDLRGFIQQSIEFLAEIQYPKSLVNLELNLMLPDFDTLIQKASKSLSIATYLSVENQKPFKEFIKSHEVLKNVKKFACTTTTKQMLSSHSKLYRCLTTHMTALEDVDIKIYAQTAKPFLYLGLYNSFVTGEKFKKISLHFVPSHIEFSGTDLLSIENKLEGLQVMNISCPGAVLPNEKIQSFFGTAAVKNIEEISLDFIQVVKDGELEKRFSLLKKCEKLRKLEMKFQVSELTEVSVEEFYKFLAKNRSLKEVDIELIGADFSEIDLEPLRNLLKVKRRIHKFRFGNTKDGIQGDECPKTF